MKRQTISVASILMGLFILFSSCKSGTTTQASNKSSKKIKNDSSNYFLNSNSKNMENTNDTEEVSNKTFAVTKQNFSNSHNAASDVIWEEYISDTKTKNYKVTYKEDSKTNSIVYATDGSIIEERQSILIDQLPQDIYNAIKEMYPNYKIMDASTYKHTNKEGSYIVHIKPASALDVNEMELIFKENGSIAQ